MAKMSETGIFQVVIECTERDYKSGPGTVLMDHRVIHKDKELGVVNSTKDIFTAEKGNQNCNNELKKYFEIMNYYNNYKKESFSYRKSKPLQGISKKDIEIEKHSDKRKFEDFENASHDRDLGNKICENKKIKQEEIDIDDTFESNGSYEIPESSFIEQETNSGEINRLYGFNQSFMLENDPLSKSNRGKVKVNNTNLHIPKGCKDHSTNKVEVEVDNTNVYIPDGWERKAYKYLKGHKGFRIFYVSPCGEYFASHIHVQNYCRKFQNRGIKLSVDIERLNFSCESIKEEVYSSSKKENDGILTHNWKKKTFQYLNNSNKKMICYYSPLNRDILSCDDMKEFIKQLKYSGHRMSGYVKEFNFGYKPIHKEKENTLNTSPNIAKLEDHRNYRVELELDNTNVYIPDGWKRKAYQYLGGHKRLFYVSPLGGYFDNPIRIKDYCQKWENRGLKISVDFERLDFSTGVDVDGSMKQSGRRIHINTSPNKAKSEDHRTYRVELELDNTNVYIPDGWKRKAYRYSSGHKRLFYISPLGANFHNRRCIKDYCQRWENRGLKTSVNIERLDFRTGLNVDDSMKQRGRRINLKNKNKQEQHLKKQNKQQRQFKKACKNGRIIDYSTNVAENYESDCSLASKNNKIIIKHEMDLAVINSLDYKYNPQLKWSNDKPLMIEKTLEIPGELVDVDNTGIYIPDGWQRIVYLATSGSSEGCYKAIYITHTGQKFGSRNQVLSFIKSHCIDEHNVDINQLDFTTSSQIRKTRVRRNQRVELEVDNTDVYIPEGWKRKAFRYRFEYNGTIVYITPSGKEIRSRRQMVKYFDQMQKSGQILPVDIDQLNFSVKTIVKND